MLQCGYINVTKIMVRILLVRIMKVKLNQRLAPELYFRVWVTNISERKKKDPERRAIISVFLNLT